MSEEKQEEQNSSPEDLLSTEELAEIKAEARKKAQAIVAARKVAEEEALKEAEADLAKEAEQASTHSDEKTTKFEKKTEASAEPGEKSTETEQTELEQKALPNTLSVAEQKKLELLKSLENMLPGAGKALTEASLAMPLSLEPPPNCKECDRPVNAQTKECYYCKELSPEQEAKVKMLLANIENEIDKNGNEGAGKGLLISVKLLMFLVATVYILTFLRGKSVIIELELSQFWCISGAVLGVLSALFFDRYESKYQLFSLALAGVTFCNGLYFALAFSKTYMEFMFYGIGAACFSFFACALILTHIMKSYKELLPSDES